MKKFLIPAALVAALLLGGCANTNDRVLENTDDESQLQRRAYQTRVFDTNDKEKVMRATISTLQDLGFVIDRTDFMLGSISATKLSNSTLKVTISVREKGKTQTSVRTNAQYNNQAVTEPKHYQNFYASLEKSLFLTAHAGE